ncbi:MAG: hypothetical protein D6823_04455, partial [Chloroflexi bacterium]
MPAWSTVASRHSPSANSSADNHAVPTTHLLPHQYGVHHLPLAPSIADCHRIGYRHPDNRTLARG